MPEEWRVFPRLKERYQQAAGRGDRETLLAYLAGTALGQREASA